MAGIDKIVQEILQEANTKAAAVLEEAGRKAGEITAQAAQADEKAAARIKETADRQAGELAQRAVSQGALRKRQAILKAKQDIIDEVIEKAYMQLSTRDDEAYFSMILTLIEKNLRAGDGKICFNEADMKRIPDGFAQKVAQLAEKAGVPVVPIAVKTDCEPIRPNGKGWFKDFGTVDTSQDIYVSCGPVMKGSAREMHAASFGWIKKRLDSWGLPTDDGQAPAALEKQDGGKPQEIEIPVPYQSKA